MLGQAYNIYKGGPSEAHISWMKQFPDEPLIRFFDIGYVEAIMLNNVKTTREALQTQCYRLEKPNFVRRVLGEINGTGVFFEEGESHKRQRRLLTGKLFLRMCHSRHESSADTLALPKALFLMEVSKKCCPFLMKNHRSSPVFYLRKSRVIQIN